MHQKQTAAIFIIFTEMKMLDRRSIENIAYFWTFLAFLLQLILFFLSFNVAFYSS